MAAIATTMAVAPYATEASAAPLHGVFAQPGAAKPMTDAQRKEEAKRLYGEANDAFDKGDFKKAHELYSAADELVPGAVPKFRAAESLDKAGDVKGAIGAYQAFLDSNPPADRNQERIDAAKSRIEALNRAPGEVHLLLNPAVPGAFVLVNGVEQTGTELKLPPGQHTITVRAPDYEEQTFEVDVAAGSKTELPVELRSAKALGDDLGALPPPPPAEEPSSGSSKIPAYVTLGLAGAGAVVGTIFGVMALSSKSDYEATPTQELFDDTERNALISDMAFGAALAFGITGVVLLLTDEDDAPSTGSNTIITPYVGPNAGGAAALFRF